MYNSFKLESLLNIFLRVFLFVLPWQTIWIYKGQFINGAKWQYGTLGFYGSEFLLWILIFLFMIFVIQKLKFSVFPPKADQPMADNFQFSLTKDRIFFIVGLLCMLYSFSSIFWSSDKDIALQHSLYFMEAFLLFIMVYVSSLPFKQLAFWFVAGSILPSILGIGQFLFQSDFASTLLGLSHHIVSDSGTSVVASDTIGRWLRAYGSFSHPNMFGGYLALAFGVALLLINKINDSHPKADPSGVERYKIGMYVIMSLQIMALFFTFSRGAWISASIAVLLYCCIDLSNFKKKISLIIILSSLAGLLAVIYFPLVQTRFAHESTLEIKSTTERVSGYREAFEIIKIHTWFGVGAGNYTMATYEFNSTRPGWEYQPVHNVGLLFLAEFGVVGVALAILLFITFVRYHIIGFVIYHITHTTYQINWYVISGMCYVILAFFDHYLLSTYLGILLSVVYFALVCRFSPVSPPIVPKL